MAGVISTRVNTGVGISRGCALPVRQRQISVHVSQRYAANSFSRDQASWLLRHPRMN